MSQAVRVRFAPSPTGPLHIGGVRTALYNYLFAKKHKGTFILRIEDTDQTRFVPGAEQYIIDAFKWCGITFDEGQGIGGPYAPYKQSERMSIYKAYADALIASGHAYYAFDTAEELDALRKFHEEQKEIFTYGINTRMGLQNSLTLSPSIVSEKIATGIPYVIRFNMPEEREVIIQDVVRGKVVIHTSTLDDKVLYKSDGLPTYHLANVVDDKLMQISHVIRGEEWLPSTPLHVLLYEAFGWLESMPAFVHLPLILKPEGKGKLSKRDGDRLGFPVFPLSWEDKETHEVSKGYKESGYFPQAFLNMLAFLGWNPGTEQEIFSLEELAEVFSLEQIGKSGSRFDPDKAKWFNHHYVQQTSVAELAALYQPILKEKGIIVSDDYVEHVCALIKDRVSFITDFWEHSSFFFQSPSTYDDDICKKKWKPESADLLLAIKAVLEEASDFSVDTITIAIKSHLEAHQIGFGQVMNVLRLVLIGSGKGPDLFQSIALLGKQETTHRIVTGIEQISKKMA